MSHPILNRLIGIGIGVGIIGSFVLPIFALSKPQLSQAEILQLTEEVTLLWAETQIAFPDFTGIVDITYGSAETVRFNTITGSDKVGFQFPCLTECAYIELAGNAYGKQWISGKYQRVLGGSGALGALYNYQEPTGRFPVGQKFKIVVWDIDEGEGTASLRAFVQICMGALGCTGYNLPPSGLELIEVQEKDILFTGFIEPAIIE